MNDLCITMDMDWAPDEVIDYSMRLLARFDVRATLFMTNATAADVGGHELAIHPNFTSMDLERHFQERLELFPKARGTRSHSFFFSERFRPIYEKLRMKYESNVMMYKQRTIVPYPMSPTTLEIPLYWMDNFYVEMETPRSYIPDVKALESAALTVFDFHPVHVFLNTNSMQLYQAAKQYYQDPPQLWQCRNTTERGTEDYLVDLLDHGRRSHTRWKTLFEVAEEYPHT